MLNQVMKERGISFKEAVNTALRAGLIAGAPRPRRFRVQPRHLGVRPNINLDKALQLAAELEDEEILRRYELGK